MLALQDKDPVKWLRDCPQEVQIHVFFRKLDGMVLLFG